MAPSNDELSAQINIFSSDMKAEMSTHKEILERVEDKVDFTNGRVTTLEQWKIAHEAAAQTRDAIQQNSTKNYRAPIFVGLVIGIPILLLEVILVWVISKS